MNDVRVTLNKNLVKNRITEGADAATYAMSAQALSDSNEYCRVDQNTAKDSAEIHSDLKRGRLIWKTKYIRKIYYTGTPCTDKNPNAQKMWAHYAASRHGKDWKRIGQAAFRKKV